MARWNRERGAGARGAPAPRRRRKLGEGLARGRHLLLECLEERRLLSLNPFISEVDASNKTGIVDAAGVAADWLEICNPDPTTAVNLAGWSLNYAKTSTTWTIPSTSNVILGPGESRVIFCDSASATDPVGELHTNFNLSKSGSTVKLINPSGTAISSLAYPALNSDTSYGVGETVAETDLVAAGVTATYSAPSSNALGTTWTQPTYSDAGWASGPTGLGFANSVSGFACTLYQANIGLGTVENADTVIDTPADQTSVSSKTESVLNFLDKGGNGHFGSDTAFPGMTVGEGLSNIVLHATGTLQISASQAGYYTFGVNSDDGFSLTITGASFSNPGPAGSGTTCSGTTMEYDGGRGAADSLATTYLAAGNYPLDLVYFQGGGDDSMEFFAAKESSASARLLRRELDSRGQFYRHHRQRRHQQHHNASGGHQCAFHRERQQQQVLGRRGHQCQVGGAGGPYRGQRHRHVAVRANRLQRNRGPTGVVDEPDAQGAI